MSLARPGELPLKSIRMEGGPAVTHLRGVQGTLQQSTTRREIDSVAPKVLLICFVPGRLLVGLSLSSPQKQTGQPPLVQPCDQREALYSVYYVHGGQFASGEAGGDRTLFRSFSFCGKDKIRGKGPGVEGSVGRVTG